LIVDRPPDVRPVFQGAARSCLVLCSPCMRTRTTSRPKMPCTGTPSGSSTDDRAGSRQAELEGGPV